MKKTWWMRSKWWILSGGEEGRDRGWLIVDGEGWVYSRVETVVEGVREREGRRMVCAVIETEVTAFEKIVLAEEESMVAADDEVGLESQLAIGIGKA